jgi:hypothetical protein
MLAMQLALMRESFGVMLTADGSPAIILSFSIVLRLAKACLLRELVDYNSKCRCAWPQEEGGMSAAQLRALPVVIHEPPLRRHRHSPSGGADDAGDEDSDTGMHLLYLVPCLHVVQQNLFALCFTTCSICPCPSQADFTYARATCTA